MTLPWHFMVHKKRRQLQRVCLQPAEENTSTGGITIECREKGCGKSIQLSQGVGKLGPDLHAARNDPSGVMEKVDTCDKITSISCCVTSTSVWQSESLTAITSAIPDDEIKLCLAKMEKCHPPGKFNRIGVIQTINPPKQLPAAGDRLRLPCLERRQNGRPSCPMSIRSKKSHRRQDLKVVDFCSHSSVACRTAKPT